MINSSARLAIVFELLGIAQAASGASLPGGLLDRVSRSVSQFWDQFSAVTCTELVTQRKLEPGGKQIVEKRSTYDYLILLQLAGDELMVEESRLLQGKAPKETDRAMLTTNGFSTLLLVFHPLFRPSYEFTQTTDEEIGGKRFHRIEFQHVRGRTSPSVLQLRSRDYPLEWRGTAWVDAESFAISRIHAELKSPMDDVGLKRLSSDVQYAPVRLSGNQGPAWMPVSATIDAATVRQRWNNVHAFSRYRRFVVDTEVKVEAPQ